MKLNNDVRCSVVKRKSSRDELGFFPHLDWLRQSNVYLRPKRSNAVKVVLKLSDHCRKVFAFDRLLELGFFLDSVVCGCFHSVLLAVDFIQRNIEASLLASEIVNITY